jgi:hypothetical protein
MNNFLHDITLELGRKILKKAQKGDFRPHIVHITLNLYVTQGSERLNNTKNFVTHLAAEQ